jgi:broad specificity phosphatase PhoE
MLASEQQKWPSVIWIVRHDESAGNVAREAAYRAGLAKIALDIRDIDVPLSLRGEQQARALGHWFGQLPAGDRPSVVLTSPYLRAARTADLIYDGAGLNRDNVSVVTDERLREKELGILDRLTRDGIGRHRPEQAELRLILGKFYHRPPGGESWCDVILRPRSVDRHAHPGVPPGARADRLSRGGGALLPLPAGAPDRAADPRDRPRGRSRELLGHPIHL